MRMLISRIVIIVSAGLVCGAASAAALEPNRPEPNAQFRSIPQTTLKLLPQAPEKLFSPSVSQLFYETAYDITHRGNITNSQAEQAIVFLNAAMELDSSTSFASADLLSIASRPGPPRHLEALYASLVSYIDKNADLQVATGAIRYLLEQLDSRKQREKLLNRLSTDIGQRNPAVNSELATMLGLFYAEKADDVNASRAMAIAYSSNRYNQLAFEKLVELVPEQISPVANMEYLRLKVRKNPLDIDAAFAFAQYAQKVQLYDIATASYEYCARLYQFLYPDKDVPVTIYLGWMTSCYNVSRNQSGCMDMLDQFRKQGRFDLQIESLAAKVAAKTGDSDLALRILNSAEQKALQLARQSDQAVMFESLAWFYCFVKPNSEQAADWANRAFAVEPNSPVAAGLLACALIDNNQLDSAKTLIDSYPQTQFAAFAKAKLLLAAEQKQPALDSLRACIDKDPGSIVAEKALSLLAEQKAEYLPIFDTTLIMTALKQTIGVQIAPQFVRPDQILSFQLNVRGNRFPYGSEFSGTISITNNWFEPLVISPNAMCKGRIIIDAEVTGDLQARFEKLVVTSTSPSQPIDPGNNTVIPARIFSGPLRELLINHPQASLNIKFTAYLDPIVTDAGLASAIPTIKPSTVQIERPAVEITREFLQNRFNTLSKGRQGPKIKAVELFAGLMMESRETAKGQPPYKLVSEPWIHPMLKSALIYGLTDSDWVVKVHSLAAIMPLPMDYELTNAASAGLNEQQWPARMMAEWVIYQKQGNGFAKVLDHIAQYDNGSFVRDMAITLGAKPPLPTKPAEQSLSELLKQEPAADNNSSATFSPK